MKEKAIHNYLGEVCEMVRLCYDFHSEIGTIVWAECIAEHLEKNTHMSLICMYSNYQTFQYSASIFLPCKITHCNRDNCKLTFTIKSTHLKFLWIVHSRNRLHQVGSRVVAKVRADITDTQTSIAGFQILRMLISRFVQCIDLWK